jgi:4-amino-4-deoxychorismate lyase
MRLGVLIDGEAEDRVEVANRGLNYGDGVFSTVLVHEGLPIWWEEHVARLRRGCEALLMRMPDADLLGAEAERLCRGQMRGVLKVTLVRGGRGRGYAPTLGMPTQRILALHPRLAGIKHLNRLENVLARAACMPGVHQEGLMRDTHGVPVCATAGNIFVVRRGQLKTPSLRQCGVEGICRGWALSRADVEIATLQDSDIENADELFVCNSVRGILPVARLGLCDWRPGPVTAALCSLLWSEVPALNPGFEEIG